MKEAQYREFEAVFQPLARAKLQELVQALQGEVPDGFGPIELLDHDVQRGLIVCGQGRQEDPPYIELVLTDGDEYGFEGVGLVLNCSLFATGQVWAPGNFSKDVGTLDTKELASRLQAMPVAEVADRIRQEWARVQRESKLIAQGYALDELERDNPYNQWMRES